jgi:ParB family chromosome partitioning protein
MSEKKKRREKNFSRNRVNKEIETIQLLPLDSITPDPHQPRKYFGEEGMIHLVESVRNYGLIQPIVVRPIEASGYMIVQGERRFRAHRKLGRTSICSTYLI